MHLRNNLFKIGYNSFHENISYNLSNSIKLIYSSSRVYSSQSNSKSEENRSKKQFNDNKSKFKKKPVKYLNVLNKFKIQKTKWLDKVDEIRKENEEKKDDLNELKTNYNLTIDNQYEILNKELIPLHLIDYETQIRIKKRRLELFIGQFLNKISEHPSTIILDSEGYPCVFNDTIRSELIDEYQTQNKFLINLDINKTIAVGLSVGTFNSGLTIVRPNKFVVCKKSHRYLASRFENYLKEKSQLRAILDYKSKEGNWIEFLVRSNSEGEHQCVGILNDQNLTDEKLKKECKLIKEYFEPLSNELNIKSFYLELINTDKKDKNIENQSNERSKFVNIFGDQLLSFKLNNYHYNIPIRSMLPINLEVYEKMINLLIENLDLSSRQNLIYFSPFSGLGIPQLSRLVGNFYIINRTKQQTDDCKKSLQHLDYELIKNIKSHEGNHLKCLFKIADNCNQEITVVIKQEDITPQILNELRNNRKIGKIALISTKPQEALMKIWIQLCISAKKDLNMGKPFNFISATPIDTHPHSNIYTILSIFERIVS